MYHSLSIMNCNVKQMFPQWVNDNKNQYSLCITDDIDSLMSACLLKEIKGYEIDYFYNFSNIYKNVSKIAKQAIGIDMANLKGKTWDNHVTMLSPNDHVNSESANLNTILRINRENYYKKYACSTLLQMWSYYDIPLPKTDETKMILLAIDSGYLGYYSKKFKDTYMYYMCEILEFDELAHILKKNRPADFELISKKYNLKSKIEIENGILHTQLDLAGLQGLFSCVDISLPKQTFHLLKEFKQTKYVTLNNNKKYKTNNKIFSIALTCKNKVKYTL